MNFVAGKLIFNILHYIECLSHHLRNYDLVGQDKNVYVVVIIMLIVLKYSACVTAGLRRGDAAGQSISVGSLVMPRSLRAIVDTHGHSWVQPQLAGKSDRCHGNHISHNRVERDCGLLLLLTYTNGRIRNKMFIAFRASAVHIINVVSVIRRFIV